MPTPRKPRPARSVILLIAEIKAALEAFERGESNAFDAVETMLVAADAYRATTRRRGKAA